MVNLRNCLNLLFLYALILLYSIPSIAGSLSVKWDSVQGASGYRIYYGQNRTDLNSFFDLPVSITNFTFMNLANCTNWYVGIKSLDPSGNESANFGRMIVGWNRPEVASLNSYIIQLGETKQFTLLGTNFFTGDIEFPSAPLANIKLNDLSVSNLSVDSCFQMSFDVTVSIFNSRGTRNLYATNPDLSDNSLSTDLISGPMQNAITVFTSSENPPDQSPQFGLLRFAGFTPGNKQTNVVPETTIQLSSNRMLKADTVHSGNILLTLNGNSVPQADNSPLFYGGLQKTVRIVPRDPLLNGMTYKVEVKGGPSGVTDTFGNFRENDLVMTDGFTVEPMLDGSPINEIPVLERRILDTNGRATQQVCPAESQILLHACTERLYWSPIPGIQYYEVYRCPYQSPVCNLASKSDIKSPSLITRVGALKTGYHIAFDGEHVPPGSILIEFPNQDIFYDYTVRACKSINDIEICSPFSNTISYLGRRYMCIVNNAEVECYPGAGYVNPNNE